MIKALLKLLCFLLCFNALNIKVEGQENPAPSNITSLEIPSRISYEIDGHHLGNNLMSYIRAKWLSSHYNIPLLYKPFPFANQLVLHEQEKKKFSNPVLSKLEAVVIKNEFDLCFEDSSPTLYMLPNYIEPEIEWNDNAPFIEVNWQNKDFKKLLKKLLKPLNSIPVVNFPRQRISVAVYIPSPFTKDGRETKNNLPLQYPPDSYYIEQINRLSDLFFQRPLFVYLFTENRNPKDILDKFKNTVSAPNILFESKTSDKITRVSSVEDFANMGKFDCLIRPANNLGFLLEQLNDYLITVKPVHFVHKNNRVHIDEFYLKFRDRN
jgi:hypothetical protein